MLGLQKFTPSDFKYLDRWIKTEEALVQFAGPLFQFPLTMEQIEDYLKDEKRNVFKVVLETDESEQSIGIAELYDFSESTNKIARVLIGDPSVRGKGIGTELIERLVQHSFENDHKQTVLLNVYDWNISAIKCYEKVGFVRTSKAPTITHVSGKEWKSVEMEILSKGS